MQWFAGAVAGVLRGSFRPGRWKMGAGRVRAVQTRQEIEGKDTVSEPSDSPAVWAEWVRSNIINLSLRQDQIFSAMRVSIFFP
jgi:hypothetical protein